MPRNRFALNAFAALCALSALTCLHAEDDLADWASEGKWPRGPNAVESTPARQYEKARRQEEIGDVKQAAESYRRMADVYTESDKAEEALIRSAKNFLSAGDFTRCREELNELRRRYSQPRYLDAYGEVQAALGRGFLEGKGEGGTYTLPSRIRKARRVYDEILNDDPEGRWADDAIMGLGRCFEAENKYDDAIKEYKKLLDKYAGSELRAEAEGRIAYCITKRHPTPEYTESESEEAHERILSALREAKSGSSALDEVALEENRQLLVDRQAEKLYDQAVFYQKNQHYRAAEIYYELIKKHYPNSKWSEKAEEALRGMRKR